MKRWLISIVLISITLLLFQGCKFKVVKDKGLQKAYTDADLLYSYCVPVKFNEDIKKKQRNKAYNLYRAAKACINGYLKKSISAASDYEVYEPLENYQKSSLFGKTCEEHVVLFVRYVEKLQSEEKSLDPIVVALALKIITYIWETNEKSKEIAYERFKDIVEHYEIVNIEALGKSGPILEKLEEFEP